MTSATKTFETDFDMDMADFTFISESHNNSESHNTTHNFTGYAKSLRIDEKSYRTDLHPESQRVVNKVVNIIYTVKNNETRYLLVKGCDWRTKNGQILRGKWGFVKGGIKPNETLRQATSREILEEVGLNCILSHAFYTHRQHVTFAKTNDLNYKFKDGEVVKAFWCTLAQIEQVCKTKNPEYNNSFYEVAGALFRPFNTVTEDSFRIDFEKEFPDDWTNLNGLKAQSVYSKHSHLKQVILEDEDENIFPIFQKRRYTGTVKYRYINNNFMITSHFPINKSHHKIHVYGNIKVLSDKSLGDTLKALEIFLSDDLRAQSCIFIPINCTQPLQAQTWFSDIKDTVNSYKTTLQNTKISLDNVNQFLQDNIEYIRSMPKKVSEMTDSIYSGYQKLPECQQIGVLMLSIADCITVGTNVMTLLYMIVGFVLRYNKSERLEKAVSVGACIYGIYRLVSSCKRLASVAKALRNVDEYWDAESEWVDGKTNDNLVPRNLYTEAHVSEIIPNSTLETMIEEEHIEVIHSNIKGPQRHHTLSDAYPPKLFPIINPEKDILGSDMGYEHSRAIEDVYEDASDSVLQGDDLEAQVAPLETLTLIAFLSTCLPAHIMKIIKNIPLFTHFKVLDDMSYIYDILAALISLPRLILEYFEICPELVESLKHHEASLPFSQMASIQARMTKFNAELERDPRLAASPDFQVTALKLKEDVNKWRTNYLSVEKVLPPFMIHTYNVYEKNQKHLQYVMSNLRVEPVWIIFEGPPGCGKTTMMNYLIKGYEKTEPVYVHSTTDEKDFYDTYCDEPIFVVDDIGQKGIYQYANMINFVSTTKFPLNCAEVTLKNTKFFTSKLILSTTNSTALTLTANSGITELEALYRRMDRVDCSKLVIDINGNFTGKMFLQKRIDKRWVTEHTIDCSQGKAHIGASLAKIIATKTSAKKRMFEQQMTESEDISFNLYAESKTIFDDIKTTSDEFIKTTFSNWEYLKNTDFARKAYDIISNNKYANTAGLIAAAMFALISGMGAYFYNWAKGTEKVVPKKQFRAYMSNRTTLTKLASLQTQGDVFLPQGDYPQQLSRIVENSVQIKASFKIGDDTFGGECCGIVSGRNITMPYHTTKLGLGEEFYVTIKDAPTRVVYDHLLVKIVFVDVLHDIIICKMARTTPVVYKKIHFIKDTTVKKMFLITPQAAIDLESQIQKIDMDRKYVAMNGFKGTVGVDDVAYKVNGAGLCGSLLVTADGFLLGHHVAGGSGIGVAKIFSKNVVQNIRKHFDEETIELPLARPIPSETVYSRIDLNLKQFNMVPSKSSLVESKIHGVFPVERVPANLTAFGKETVNEMSKKSHVPCADIDLQCLEFATEYIRTIIPVYDPLTEKEVVLGNDDLNPIDKKTSCGFGFPGQKSDYLDFEKGRYLKPFKEHLDKVRRSMKDDTYAFDSVHAEILKDELRDVEKRDKPRAFKMSPIDILCLQRHYFGDLLGKLHRRKFVNGIMIGVNPFSEDWKKLIDFVTAVGPNVFDGDWKNWDGRMLPQFQQQLNKVISSHASSKFSERDVKAIDQLLAIIMFTPTVTGNKSYLTNHSLPSGTGLTADYNSWINKMYTAYVFAMLYRSKFGVMPTMTYFLKHVRDAVYGDDKLVGVSNEVASWFHARSFEHIAISMGLGFTPADKGEWTYNTRTVWECTFLKRSFVMHPDLGIVAPLEAKSMLSTLNFVKDGFRNDELTTTKMWNFQREAFLHYNNYNNYMQHLEKYSEQVNFPVQMLNEKYLVNLYTAGDYGETMEMY